MIENSNKRERGSHGWYQPGPRAYATLLKSEAVQMFADSLPAHSKSSGLYQFLHFLEYNKLGPEELLGLGDEELKQCIRKAIMRKRQESNFASGRLMFYMVRRFLEINGREVSFNRTEKKALLKMVTKRIGRQYIPTREDIYRMVDSFPDKGPLQRKRGQALLLCLWQSGVRVNCLCSWTYGMFKKQLSDNVSRPLKIKVVASRPEGVCDCAQDTKLSSYSVNYYYTFLNMEAAEALRNYLDERRKQGWNPQDCDPVFVTHGTVLEENGRPLKPQHIVEIVKNAAKMINIDPASIWTHCLRKAFRKTLYSGGIDPDVAEALMGHKLGASRGSYFDYHDMSFALKNYTKGAWTRLGLERLESMEIELVELRKAKEELDRLKENGHAKEVAMEQTARTIKLLLGRVEELEKRLNKN